MAWVTALVFPPENYFHEAIYKVQPDQSAGNDIAVPFFGSAVLYAVKPRFNS
jgi:hypothetical protein